mgnify:FL=1
MSLNHTISRRTIFRGTGAVAAASALGAGAALGTASPAHAAELEVVNQETDGRMQTYEFTTPSIRRRRRSFTSKVANPGLLRNPRANVLLPDGYDSGKRYPVLYLFHGGGGQYTEFDGYNIREMTS